MKGSISCAWCFQLNEPIIVRKVYCWHCGHRADVARVDCDCRICRIQREFHEVQKGAAA
jgi:hypothetical protein